MYIHIKRPMLQLFGGFWANCNKSSKLHLKAKEVACEEKKGEGGREREE